ncbi:hypothetical protein TNCV_4932611 [Trichonephila clavipes]|nr:hypothetical protein TNCV_4932611 [Trichonephila clavipes]
MCRGGRCSSNLSRIKHPPYGVVVSLERVPAWVSSSSLDHGSKLRDPSPIALVQSYIVQCGHGNLVVKVTDPWPVCHEFEPCTTKDPPCRGDQ